jgi:hypothetical protein
VAVSNAVVLAANDNDPKQAADKLRKLLELGLAVADGRNTWQEPACRQSV